MAKRISSKKNPFVGYPKGWFVVAFSDELPVGGVLKMKYFGTELVAFRGESGAVAILDAYCPHLGAHLGAGGKVVGDTIECPFHAWKFNLGGKCVAIPYAKTDPPKIPVKAVTRAWNTVEKNGCIYLWHAPLGGPPEWEVPTLDVWGDESWLPWSHSKLHIKTHPREILENVVDKGHFPRVHNTNITKFENEFTDLLAIQRSGGVAYPVGGGKDEFEITATYHGPGFQVSQMSGVLQTRLLNAHVPVDEHSLDLRFGVMIKIVGGNAAKTQGFAARYVDNLTKGFQEDVAIWENKCFRQVPVLCDGDGPIMKLREWYARFYDDNHAEE